METLINALVSIGYDVDVEAIVSDGRGLHGRITTQSGNVVQFTFVNEVCHPGVPASMYLPNTRTPLDSILDPRD